MENANLISLPYPVRAKYPPELSEIRGNLAYLVGFAEAAGNEKAVNLAIESIKKIDSYVGRI